MPVLVAIVSAITALAAVARISGGGEWAIEPYAGVFRMDDGERSHDPFQRFDDQGVSTTLGVRALLPVTDRWEVGAEYGYVGFESKLREGDPDLFPTNSDIEIHVVLGQARRSWSLDEVVLAATMGAGAMVIDAGEFRSFEPPPPGGLVPANFGPRNPEREVEPLVTLGLGARRPIANRVAVSVEARDLMQACQDPSESFANASRVFCDRDAWLHHIQLTAALRIEF
jgi:hypothetical protein